MNIWAMIVVAVAAWIISPIPLAIMFFTTRNKKNKQSQLLLTLYQQKRISYAELIDAGVIKPDAPAQPAVQQPAVPVPMPVPPTPEQTLADAAARAVRIADAEIEGIPLSDLPAEHADAPELTEVSAPAADEAPVTAPEPVSEPLPAEDLPAPEHITEAAPEAPVFTAAPAPAVPQPAAPQSAALPQQSFPKQPGFQISAIAVMLSVGVLLIITAGLIFVRSAWESLSDLGRLTTLAAGSALFFSTSALAHRVWKLTRTGMAFYTLGAAFLPISVWAAGYLHLLGDGLSGADNPWLYAFAFAAFTVVALLAVKIYQQIGWGIASLCGLTGTYIAFIIAITGGNAQGISVRLLALSVYALLLTFGSRFLRQKQLLPLALGRVIEPFAIGFTFLTVLLMCSIPFIESTALITAAAAFLTAFAFFAPAFTERIRSFSAIFSTPLALIGFGKLMQPLVSTVFTYQHTGDVHFAETLYTLFFAEICMVCAIVWLLLLLTNSLPDHVRKGYYFSAVSLSGLAVVSQLFQIRYVPVLVPATAVLLLLGWLAAARHSDKKLPSLIISALCWGLCFSIAFLIPQYVKMSNEDNEDIMLLLTGLFLFAFAATALTKKHRTAVSDLLFTVSAGNAALYAADFYAKDIMPEHYISAAFMGCMVLVYWALALAHDKKGLPQYIFAVLSPLTLFCSFAVLSDTVFRKLDSVVISIAWSAASIVLGYAVYFTTHRRFHGVRRLMFALFFIPPMFCAVFAHIFDDGLLIIWQQVLCAAAATGLFILFSNRGFRKLAAASFSAALLLMIEATVYLCKELLYKGEYNFTIAIIAALWIIAFSIVTLVIRKGNLRFVGSDTIADVMQYAAAGSALVLSVILIGLAAEEWDAFYFVVVFGMGILAWLITGKTQVVLPACCCTALVFSAEALRRHSASITTGGVILLLLFFAGMTLLMPYLGQVLREYEDDPRQQRRTWVLTVLGAVPAFWSGVAAASGTVTGSYSDAQVQWLAFFIPVLLAGYLLHFVRIIDNPDNRRKLLTISAALGMFAFWIQPVVNVTDTYFEGKLHILPMIAFALVIRKLYGDKVGGDFLFGVGVYTMLRLGLSAIASESGADIATVLLTALVMFIASFYIKQKKWFLLGGISLITLAAYLHMKLTDGTQWWVYLLLTGLVLIVVAASNEMLKQRGDSLKSRAGRLWEDWSW